MNTITILHLGSFIANILLIALVLGRRSESLLNRICALFIATIAFWSLFSALVTMAADSQEAMLYLNISSLGWCFVPTASLWFYLALDNKDNIFRNKAFISVTLLIAAGFMYAQWSGNMLYLALPAAWGWTGIWKESIAAYAYYIYYFIITGTCMYLIIDFGRKVKSHRQKMQARLLLITGTIAMLLSTLTDVVFRIVDIRVVPDVADIFFMVLGLGIVFAVLKYGLMSLTPTVAAETILSTVSDSIILLDTNLQIVYTNRATTDLLEYNENEFQGASFGSLNEDKDSADDLLEETLRAGSVNREISYLSRSGKSIPVLASTSIVCNSADDVIGIVISAKDITERKKAEEAVRQSEEKYRMVVDNAQETIFINVDGVLTFANKRAALLGGYSEEELTSRPFIEFIHPDDRQMAIERHLRRLSGMDVPSKFTFRVVFKPGDIRWAELVTVPITWEGRPATLNFLTDITERRQAEAALIESEARYRMLSEHTTDTVWLMDRDLKVTYISGTEQKLRGFTPQEILGMPLEAQLTPDSLKLADGLFLEELPKVDADPSYNPIYALELEFFRKDGTILWAESRFSIIRDASGKAVSLLGEARDITKRRQAEHALIEREAQYRLLAEHTTDFIWLMDMSLNPTYQSPSAEKLTGFTQQELMELPFEKRITPESLKIAAELFLEEMPRVEADPDYNPIITLDLEVYRKDGTTLWSENKFSVIRDGNGRAISIIGEARDISAHKRAEEALQKTENTYRLLAEHMSDVVWLMDLDLNVTWLSPSSAKVRGYSLDETIALPLDRQLTPESFGKAVHLLGKWMHVENEGRTPEPYGTISLELEFTCKDGSTVWLECILQFIRDGQGKATGILAEGRDITARKEAEDALLESEEKYRTVVENAQEAIFIAVDGMLKFANSRAAEISGYSLEEFFSRPFIEFIHPDDRQMVAERYIQWLNGMDVPKIDTLRIIFKGGDIKWAELSVVPIIWEGKPATLSFLTDITDRKRLEEEQQRAAKLESLGVLAGGIAHDFNNILTAIMGNISLASMEAQAGSEMRDRLEEAQKALLRAKGLTQQLLTFSMGGSPVKRLASLDELLKDSASFSLAGSNVRCNYSIPADLWHAEIDEGQVSQVVYNLVINAQQAMPLGGIMELCAENIILSETRSLGRGLPLKEGKYIRIAVTDHGSGIPAEHLDRIFDPFFTTKQKGSGLGLATAFSIAHNHDGHISVESAFGSGSTFYFYLPASTKKATRRQDKKVDLNIAGKARILVMDDEEGVRDVAGRMLRRIGYENVDCAADGAEAIKLYKAALEAGQPFSVVILDLTIPGGMGGIATIRELLKIDPAVKAIVSTGYTDKSVMAEYKKYGFSGAAAKPYTIEQLGQAVLDVTG